MRRQAGRDRFVAAEKQPRTGEGVQLRNPDTVQERLGSCVHYDCDTIIFWWLGMKDSS